MKILVLNSKDRGGGAADIARRVADGYTAAGHEVRWIVGTKVDRTDETVIEVPFRGTARAAAALAGRLARWFGLGTVQPRNRLRWRRLLQTLELRSSLAQWRGVEDFELAGARAALEALPWRPDVVHAHNLHSFNHHTHFDLRLLPALSRQSVTLVTLHDAWLLTGHCAHFMQCGRWRSGCGECPDLGIFPPLRRDGTAANWQRKAALVREARLHVVGVSEWIARLARESLLAPGLASVRVIRNGIDVALYRPCGDRPALRRSLGVPIEAKLIAFASELGARNPFRDFVAMQASGTEAARRLAPQPVVLVALGGEQPGRTIAGNLDLRSPGFVDRAEMIRWLQASDVVLHAAIADTAPTIVYEAMACGVPVVATRVCGIPEQVDHGVTGVLVPPGDREELTGALHALLLDDRRASALGSAARRKAEAQFSHERMVRGYLDAVSGLAGAGV